MNKILFIGAFCTFLSTSLFAHGGHTEFENHIWHFMFSPGHLFIAAMGVLGVSGFVWRKSLACTVVRLCAQKDGQ